TEAVAGCLKRIKGEPAEALSKRCLRTRLSSSGAFWGAGKVIDGCFSTKCVGLNERETQLLLLKGLLGDSMSTTGWLSHQSYDSQQMGFDLGLGESTPELPLEYQDLLEKIQKLADGNQRRFTSTRVAFSKARIRL